MATLADVLRQTGYAQDGTLATPASESPMTKVLSEHIKSLPQKFEQNQAEQMALLAKAYPGNTYESMMTQGDPKALAELGMQTPFNAMIAYHGTPHNILGKFDISKVGTGEGAQAYGHGMYFAEAPTVAESYKTKLSGGLGSASNELMLDGKPLENLTDSQRRAYEIVARDGRKNALGTAKDLEAEGFDASHIREALKATKGKEISLTKNEGNLYKVDIPDEYIPNMLNWDKPLIQQPNVMKALKSEAEKRVKDRVIDNLENDIRSSLPPIDVGNDYMAMFSDANVKAGQEIKRQALEKMKKMDLSSLFDKELESMKPRDMNWNMTGKEYYEYLSKNQGSAKNASEFFKNQGVPGIRYLDEGSRARGKGTSNFVVFDPSEVQILEKNSQPISRKELIEEQINKLKD